MKTTNSLLLFLVICFLGTSQFTAAQLVSKPKTGGAGAWRTIGTTTVNGGY